MSRPAEKDAVAHPAKTAIPLKTPKPGKKTPAAPRDKNDLTQYISLPRLPGQKPIESEENMGPQLHPISDLFADENTTETYAPPKWLTAWSEDFYTSAALLASARETSAALRIGPPAPEAFMDAALSSQTQIPFFSTSTLATIKPAPTPLTPPTEKYPLDLNVASMRELLLLPGINRYRADLILAHRRAIEGFKNVGQLREVFGISETLFAKIEPVVKVGLYTPPRPLYPRGPRRVPTPAPTKKISAPSIVLPPRPTVTPRMKK